MDAPTLEQVLALPYGDADSGGLLSLSDLLALPYSGSPAYAQGLTGATFRDSVRGPSSERVLWLRAVDSVVPINGVAPSAQGKVFVPQSVPEGVRVRITSNQKGTSEQEFGEIGVGDATMTFMPDELFPVNSDRFVCLDRELHARLVLAPSTSQTRSLSHPYPCGIAAVYGGGEKLRPSRYALRQGRLVWLEDIPTFDVTVFYAYHEAFEWYEGDIKIGPLGSDGVRLPSSLPLRLLTQGE